MLLSYDNKVLSTFFGEPMTAILHPSMQDFEDVFQFMNRCDIEEYGEPDTSRQDFEELWSEINLEQDAWIIRDEQGNLTGYASIKEATTSYIQELYVSMNLSPNGIEDQLMKVCEDRVKQQTSSNHQLEKSSITGYAQSVNLRLQQIYERFGFIRHTYHYNMRIDFLEPYAPPHWPQQYRLDTFSDKDEKELYHLIESAFDWTGHTMPTIDSWRNLLFRGGRYDPQLFVLLRDGTRLIGAVLSYFEENSGWIRQLAVHKDYQGKGLGALLLKQMFSVFSQLNASGVGLAVSSLNEKACQFYERNGMRRSREIIEYRKQLA
jgi:ribosomal protein S18 acetylase RimI-like enzyme